MSVSIADFRRLVLGYVPFGHDGTPGGRLAFLRNCVGLTQVEVVRLTGVDVVHLWRYERNRLPPDGRYRTLWNQLVTVSREVELFREIGLGAIA